MTERTGGCLCGQVRYRITAEPAVSRVCWCRDCQRISSNGTVNALVPSAAIEITGTVSQYVKTSDSGNQVTRRFCGQCGSQLFADSTGRPGSTVVRVGTLDDASSVRPSANIWSASAPAWACLDPALSRVEGQPLPPQAPNSAA
ncbi:GFA family protein [Rubrivivax sp. RP6-9]|uniref:GFA family protein n=1 Tax=Rubrivivax sp. RP6-9 TaxID=3415750 RepID=UPI003CC5242C